MNKDITNTRIQNSIGSGENNASRIDLPSSKTRASTMESNIQKNMDRNTAICGNELGLKDDRT
jgi:hypothetical protein